MLAGIVKGGGVLGLFFFFFRRENFAAPFVLENVWVGVE